MKRTTNFIALQAPVFQSYVQIRKKRGVGFNSEHATQRIYPSLGPENTQYRR